MDFRPIGILDSGVGGLITTRTIIDRFPEGSITYIGDTAHTPYGPEPVAQMHELVLDIMDSLVDSDVKTLATACNSTSTAALYDACERYQVARLISAVEAIWPTVRCVVLATRNRRIGVAGMEAAIGLDAHEDAFAATPHLTSMAAACPELVEPAEAEITAGPRVGEVAERHLAPMHDAGVDTFAPGCTHHPLFVGVIGYAVGEPIALVSSADETARDAYARLASRNLFTPPGNEPDRRFYATGDPARSGELAGGSLDPEVGAAYSISQISSGVSA